MMVTAACVGRDREIDVLSTRLRTVSGAELIAISGNPGCGKSTLLTHLVQYHLASPDAGTTLWARVSPWQAATPGSLIRQLLQDQQVEPDRAGDLVDALLEATASDVPVLVAVDDADLADEESLQALVTLIREHRTRRILVVVTTARPGTRLAGQAFDELRLEGVDAQGTADLAGQRGIVLHPAMRAELTRHTSGNPRDIVALLDEVPAGTWARSDAQLPAPAHVVRAVRERLPESGTPAGALIEALAILDVAEPLSTALALAGVEDPLAAIDDARRTGLVTSDGALTPAEVQPRIVTPLVRAAILEVLGMKAVGAAHRRAADVVVDPARRLHHRVAATPTADAGLADDLADLARMRGADGAWAEAAGLYRQSGRLTPDPLERDTRVTLAVDSLLAAGDCTGAGALVPTVESLRETPLRNATLAYLAILRGRSAEAQLRLDRAWDIVNVDREPDVAALIAQRHVLHNLVRCQGAELVTWADRAITMAGSGSAARVEAAVIRGLGLAWSGHPDAARAEYDSVSEQIRYGAQAQRAIMGRGWLQLGLDEIDAARTNLETAVSMAQLGGSTRISMWAVAWLARVQFLTGDWDEAMRNVEAGHGLARSSGIALTTPLLNWTASQIHSLRGNWEAAHRSVAENTTSAGDYEIMRIPDMLARAQLAEAAADYGKVRRILAPLRTMSESVPALSEPGLWPWVDVLGNALVLEGQYDAADDLLRDYEKRSEERGHRSSAARMKYARGRFLGATGDIHGARRTFEDGIQLLDGLGLRYDQARVNFAYGQTLRRAGKRRAADAVIGTARDLYVSLGATTYVERCDRELKAGGLAVSRVENAHAAKDVAELTPQEEAVTTLVARGLSNREVAAELFISPKTVQYHLTRIYAKLGLRSRSELAASRR
ncbi:MULTISPECIES: helix-turn-helix transcriptional regulator [Gordonia]|jgi:DNA-binding CsgD family transcriptional regulator/energy-coupling factor transporter ATP-binding protein EcfA2|uniref:LuxR family transcriptional regulator n=2 Tax=Gordonia alkanivorans TaxID=84096 RepID=W9D9A3_9ACTN|nr:MULTISPECIES: LuxR family transcriptional regulator [Gordonia]ETA04917.1 LuxR family transcriptional regulator [Gordonia alkanivorans CGMCC 6845]MDH3008720.1 LuxR family transcriptional regulator [Gordonia alkanivorans]MDH3012308.1 LuxR family transcriptional regulator [Gordonia alkanivorans]MDH3017441.1 LuxR family transcriptional regulator [Gordonia alkanivorans]MDH3021025.1 LuxR family transcriptional regulator [Gordonia alkanivorans]